MERGVDYLEGGTKRSLDVIGALALMGVASPLLVPALGGACLASHSVSPLFRQERLGKYGNTFEIIKLQTLQPAKVIETDNESFGTFDPRANFAGKVLRQSSIDELPQVFNILRGDMSLVGIRPVREKTLDKFRKADAALYKDWYEGAYTAARPGIIGPGQIYRKGFRVSSDKVYGVSMRHDLQYMERASLSEDLRIIATAPLALMRASITARVALQPSLPQS